MPEHGLTPEQLARWLETKGGCPDCGADKWVPGPQVRNLQGKSQSGDYLCDECGAEFCIYPIFSPDRVERSEEETRGLYGDRPCLDHRFAKALPADDIPIAAIDPKGG